MWCSVMAAMEKQFLTSRFFPLSLKLEWLKVKLHPKALQKKETDSNPITGRIFSLDKGT